MFEVIFLCILGTAWVLFATIQDIKSREVADWLNYSLIIFALGFRFFYSLFSNSLDFSFFYQGLIGLGIFFIFGNVLYYSHFFAGGDAKLMIALGTILPFSYSFILNLRLFLVFFLVFLFIGAVYGIACSFVLAIINYNSFNKEFKKRFKNSKKIISVFLIIGILFLFLGYFYELFLFLGIIVFLSPYFLIFAKSVEECCMIKKLKPNELTEGDWLYEDVSIKGNKIYSKWEGLNKKEIALLKKHKKDVKIKQGIPFVPVFLISFILYLIFYFYGILFGTLILSNLFGF